jgi:hypothetical protein
MLVFIVAKILFKFEGKIFLNIINNNNIMDTKAADLTLSTNNSQDHKNTINDNEYSIAFALLNESYNPKMYKLFKGKRFTDFKKLLD